MKVLLTLVLLAALALSALSASQAPASSSGKLRLGTYDSRAIALAYAPSRFNPVKEKLQALERAREAGDHELEAWGEKHQRELHRMGFSRVPVDALLAHVADRLPSVAEKAGVDAIVWIADYTGPNVEVLDVTDELVMLFDPSEKTLAWIEDLRDKAPLDLDEVERGHEH